MAEETLRHKELSERINSDLDALAELYFWAPLSANSAQLQLASAARAEG